MNDFEECNAFEAFFSVVWYNGYKDEIDNWIKDLGEDYIDGRNPRCPLGLVPSDANGAYDFGQSQVLWMCLVKWYGDYGTSPRYGWIERKYWDECKEFLEAIVARYDEYESYNGGVDDG